MMNIDEMKARAAVSERHQTLNAMNRVVLKLGGKEAYVQWLNAFPDGVEMTGAGSVSNAAMHTVAQDEEMYESMLMAFARIMGPVLAEE